MPTDRLLAFCGSKAERYDLDKPWVFHGWRYATNGRIAVREPTTKPDTDDGRKRPRTTYQLFHNFPTCTHAWPHHDGTVEYDVPASPRGIASLAPLIVSRYRIRGESCRLIEALGDVHYAAKSRTRDVVKFTSGALQGVVAVLSDEE